MKLKKSQTSVLIILHALLLVIATICLQYTNMIRKDEFAVFKYLSIFKHNILGIDSKPFKGKVIFIDVSQDKALISLPPFGGNIDIADREKLAMLIRELNRHAKEYRYVLCDILFQLPSPSSDPVLKPEIEKAERIIIPASIDSDQKLIYDVKSGVAEYFFTGEDKFAKIPIYYGDSLKSLPALLYEDVTTNRYSRKWGITFLNEKLAFNTTNPEYYYRNYDLKDYHQTDKPNLLYLSQLLSYPDSIFFQEFLKDKFIVIGNFQDDVHETYIGKLSGSLILFDIFLSLHEHSNQISYFWLIFLFIVYLFISYEILHAKNQHFEDIQRKVYKYYIKETLKKMVSYLGLFIIINIISYFVFNYIVNILYIVTYLSALSFILKNWGMIKSHIEKFLLIMSRKIILFTIAAFVLSGPSADAQRCTCYFISTSNPAEIVKQNGKALHQKDTINIHSPIYIINPSTILTFGDLNGGIFNIGFQNDGKIKLNQRSKNHSELWEIIISEYEEKFKLAQGTLGHRGEFDWFRYFREFGNNSTTGKLLMIENEKIPLNSEYMPITSNMALYACIYTGQDTLIRKLDIISDTLVLALERFRLSSHSPKGVFQWKLMVGRSEGEGETIGDVSGVLSSQFFSYDRLCQIVKYLCGTIKFPDNESLKIYIREFFEYHYGKLNPFALEECLAKVQ